MSMQKVADKAGVSTATVSRVINRRAGVSKENLLRVTQAMKAVGYEVKEVRPGPKPCLSSQAARKSGCIGLVVLGRYHEVLQHPLIVQLVSEVRSAIREKGYHLLLEEMDPKEKTCAALEEKRLEGAFVITAAKGSQHRLEDLNDQLPIVHILGTEHGACTVDHVSANNRLVGETAFGYLQSKGVRQFVFVDINGTRHDALIARGRAFRDGAIEAGASVRQVCLKNDNFNPDQFYTGEMILCASKDDVVKQLLEIQEAPVGLFFATDEQLVAIVPELDRAGWQVGRDYEVIGCNNVDLFLDGGALRYVTVDLNVAEMTRQGVMCLMRRIEDPDVTAVEVLVAPKLVQNKR